MTELLTTRAIDHANLLRRLAFVARHPEPEQIYGPAPITDPVVGDLALVDVRGKWRYGIVTAIGDTEATITYVTVAGLNKARRDAHYHQNVKLDGYPEQMRDRAPEAKRDAVFAAALIEQYATRIVTTEPWVAWTPLATKIVELDELIVIRG